MLINAIYAQLILLGVILLWFVFSQRRTNIESLIKVGSIMVLLLGFWLGGVWVYPPVYGLLIIALIFAGLVVLHFRKPISQASRWRVCTSNLPILVTFPLACFLSWQGVSGRLIPSGEFIELSPPFKPQDRVCVLSGGISPLLNFHIFPSEAARDLAQQYALDIIKVRPNGFRTREGHSLNPKPKNIEAYEMFGTSVLSPCNGKVVEHENDLPDQPIGSSDKVRTGGNGIVLQCGDHHLHLHHMQQGSVLVELGELVNQGQGIGRIGNSGNTIEPHLHMHAETIVEKGDATKHGKPIHMRFDGRFMARGDCF